MFSVSFNNFSRELTFKICVIGRANLMEEEYRLMEGGSNLMEEKYRLMGGGSNLMEGKFIQTETERILN
jgi:hypothetical protein